MRTLLFAMLALAASAAFGQNSLILYPSANGRDSFVRDAPTYIDNRVLAANVSETHTVPTGSRIVLFSADCNFYAKPGASAAVPGVDVTDGTGSELNPSSWGLNGVTQITVIAATACKVSLTFNK